ncbi:hypothetical protein KAJ02_12030, partial [Candidatus Bipolaricaulota bacterium]|nr:hypothetical protein [Candidatus Bipolaricaulota bacterium]
MTPDVTVLSVAPRTAELDGTARSVVNRTRDILDIDPGVISTATVYTIAPSLSDPVIANLLTHGLGDTILQTLRVGQPLCPTAVNRFIAVDRLPGVTDDRASTLSTVLSDLGNGTARAHAVHVRDVYWIESSLDDSALQSMAERVIGNPLVQAFGFGPTETYEGFVESA